MIVLIGQDTILNRQNLSQLLDKYGQVEYKFDPDMIRDDLAKADKLLSKAITSVRAENLKRVKVYLKGLLNKAEQGPFKVDWVLNRNKVTSIPVEIRKLRFYNIQATDYIINDNNTSILYLDYLELLDIIAYEIAHRDFDIQTEEIEEKISTLSLIATHDSKVLKDIIEDKSYDKAMVMRVGNSAYLSSNNRKMYTYFGDDISFDGTYRNVIDESCSKAMSIILYNILNRANTLGCNLKIYGVFEESLCLAFPDGRDEHIEKELTASVIVRAFGRKFEVRPKVQIY